MTRPPYEPDSSLRDQLARSAHDLSSSFMSDPAYHATWEDLDPKVRDVYLQSQDQTLLTFASWLQSKAEEIEKYASMCVNPARETYRQQAQGLRNTARTLREPAPVTDLAPEVAQLKKELELTNSIVTAARALADSDVLLTVRPDLVDLLHDLDHAVAEHRRIKLEERVPK